MKQHKILKVMVDCMFNPGVTVRIPTPGRHPMMGTSHPVSMRLRSSNSDSNYWIGSIAVPEDVHFVWYEVANITDEGPNLLFIPSSCIVKFRYDKYGYRTMVERFAYDMNTQKYKYGHHLLDLDYAPSLPAYNDPFIRSVIIPWREYRERQQVLWERRQDDFTAIEECEEPINEESRKAKGQHVRESYNVTATKAGITQLKKLRIHLAFLWKKDKAGKTTPSTEKKPQVDNFIPRAYSNIKARLFSKKTK